MRQRPWRPQSLQARRPCLRVCAGIHPGGQRGGTGAADALDPSAAPRHGGARGAAGTRAGSGAERSEPAGVSPVQDVHRVVHMLQSPRGIWLKSCWPPPPPSTCCVCCSKRCGRRLLRAVRGQWLRPLRWSREVLLQSPRAGNGLPWTRLPYSLASAQHLTQAASLPGKTATPVLKAVAVASGAHVLVKFSSRTCPEELGLAGCTEVAL